MFEGLSLHKFSKTSCYGYMQQAYSKWCMESRWSPRDKNWCTVSTREQKKEWVTQPKSRKKHNWSWIITCCGDAKLTLLGTSNAICVETPPMSNTPAVRFLTNAACWSLPGTLTSTTASPSWQESTTWVRKRLQQVITGSPKKKQKKTIPNVAQHFWN